MANYANLLATIAANIYTNHNEEITAVMVKTACDSMVASLGRGYQYIGVATPATNPGTPDAKVFYFAPPDTYPNFGNITTPEYGILYWDTSWHFRALGLAINQTIIEGNVTNNPDNEDIASVNDELKFANRTSGDGMSYIIMRTNESFADQLTMTDCIYEIRYDFDLGGQSVSLPTNCILFFNGGRILNGTLTGEVLNEILRPEWFGDGSDDTQAVQNCLNIAKHKIVFDGEYNANSTYLDIVRPCTLTSTNKQGIIHFTRMNCVSTDSVSLDGCIIENITFDGDMACDGLVVKANNIIVRNCTFKNIKATDTYSGLTSAIFVGDYYSALDNIVFENVLVDGCVFDTGEPYNTTSTADSNSTTARFVLVNNCKDVRINNNTFKNLVGLKDSDCIQLVSNTENINQFPFSGSGNWSGGSNPYSGKSYSHAGIFVNKNVFFLKNTKSAVKVMASDVSVDDNKFYVTHDYTSPLGTFNQYSVLRAYYCRNVFYTNNQIVLQNIKGLDSIFELEHSLNCLIEGNSIGSESLNSVIESVCLFALNTNNNVQINDNCADLNPKTFYLLKVESNGTVTFDNLSMNINFVDDTAVQKNLISWENHYIYPSNTEKGLLRFNNCRFNFTGTFASARLYCLSEKSFEFENCVFNLDGKIFYFELYAVCDRPDVFCRFVNIIGDSVLYVRTARGNQTPDSGLYTYQLLVKYVNILTYCLFSSGSIEIKDSAFAAKLDNHQIQLNGSVALLDGVRFQNGIMQVRNNSGNSVCSVRNIDANGDDVVSAYVPGGTLSIVFLKSFISSKGLTFGSTTKRNEMNVGSNIIENGFSWFNVTTNQINFWNGTKWVLADGSDA